MQTASPLDLEELLTSKYALSTGVVFIQSIHGQLHLECCGNRLYTKEININFIYSPLFRKISWCSKCIDLHIEIAHPVKEDPGDEQAHTKKVLQLTRKKFKPKLHWLKSLESLKIISCGDGACQRDPFISELIMTWMYGPRRELLPRSLNRLWIDEHILTSHRFLAIDYLPADMKSLIHCSLDEVSNELNNDKFKQIEHLGGFDFSETLNHMTQLKYAKGLCVENHVLKTNFSSSKFIIIF